MNRAILLSEQSTWGALLHHCFDCELPYPSQDHQLLLSVLCAGAGGDAKLWVAVAMFGACVAFTACVEDDGASVGGDGTFFARRKTELCRLFCCLRRYSSVFSEYCRPTSLCPYAFSICRKSLTFWVRSAFRNGSNIFSSLSGRNCRSCGCLFSFRSSSKSSFIFKSWHFKFTQLW